jgi:mono/diheme cytochrome c family protein
MVIIVVLTYRGLIDAPVNITPSNAAFTTRFKKDPTEEDRRIIARGKALYETEAKPIPCISCHALGGKGGGASMPLDGIGTRRTYEWLIGHTRDPQKYVPNSTMPAYPPDQLTDTDLRALTDYMIQPTHSQPIIEYNNP